MGTELIDRLRAHPDLAEPAFEAAEYRARQARARDAMAARGIDVMLFNHMPSICYLSGYETPATSDNNCLVLSQRGEAVLQVIEHEVPNAFVTACIDDIRAFAWYRPESIPAQLAAIIRDVAPNIASPRIGIESDRPALTLGLRESLAGAFPSAAFINATDLLYPERVIKSPAEIAYLKHSGNISVRAAEAALDLVRPGCTDNDIAAAAYATMIAAGSEYVSTQPFIATGPRSGMVHTSFRRRPLQAGEAIFVETASSIRRYTAPVMRSAVLGSPTQLHARLRDGVATTLEILLSTIAAGRTAHEVAMAAWQGFAPIREEIYFQGAFGYHVGLSLPPAWWEGLSPYIAQGVEEELRPGMVFHLPVAARIAGVCGVALSETVVVTATGCEPLTATSRAFRDIPI
jgi:Xaa-Pro dipeptidase